MQYFVVTLDRVNPHNFIPVFWPYHIPDLSNSNLPHNYLYILLATLCSLMLYSFCVNSVHSLRKLVTLFFFSFITSHRARNTVSCIIHFPLNIVCSECLFRSCKNQRLWLWVQINLHKPIQSPFCADFSVNVSEKSLHPFIFLFFIHLISCTSLLI